MTVATSLDLIVWVIIGISACVQVVNGIDKHEGGVAMAGALKGALCVLRLVVWVQA